MQKEKNEGEASHKAYDFAIPFVMAFALICMGPVTVLFIVVGLLIAFLGVGPYLTIEDNSLRVIASIAIAFVSEYMLLAGIIFWLIKKAPRQKKDEGRKGQ